MKRWEALSYISQNLGGVAWVPRAPPPLDPPLLNDRGVVCLETRTPIDCRLGSQRDLVHIPEQNILSAASASGSGM